MAVIKRGKGWAIALRIAGRQCWLSTEAEGKTQAESIERQIKVALELSDFRTLTPDARIVLVRFYRNQGWEIPETLGPPALSQPKTLTLGEAIKVTFAYPGFTSNGNEWRSEYAAAHLVDFFGMNKPVEDMWISDVREYQAFRLGQGAAPATVNKEKNTLSRIFQVLLEMRKIQTNPIRLVKPLSEKASKRHVYLSFEDVQQILEYMPEWYRPIIQTAYYTGMRRGEVLGLSWARTDLDRRLITLGPEDVKERAWKRVPIHRDLLPILKKRRAERLVGLDLVFHRGGRDLKHRDRTRWTWDRGVAKCKFADAPHFHDLRHTWKTNARRSGVHPEIERLIMGHASAGRSVHDGYGMVSDRELLSAIDQMTFDHGETEILVSARASR